MTDGRPPSTTHRTCHGRTWRSAPRTLRLAAVLTAAGLATTVAALGADATASASVSRVGAHDAVPAVPQRGGAAGTARLGSPQAATSRRVKYFIVPQPGNGRAPVSLSDIAQATLGNATLFTELFALNKGRLQPNGGRLENPDMIEPGWVIVLLSAARGPGVHVGPLPTGQRAPAPHPTPTATVTVTASSASAGSSTATPAPPTPPPVHAGSGGLLLGWSLIIIAIIIGLAITLLQLLRARRRRPSHPPSHAARRHRDGSQEWFEAYGADPGWPTDSRWPADAGWVDDLGSEPGGPGHPDYSSRRRWPPAPGMNGGYPPQRPAIAALPAPGITPYSPGGATYSDAYDLPAPPPPVAFPQSHRDWGTPLGTGPGGLVPVRQDHYPAEPGPGRAAHAGSLEVPGAGGNPPAGRHQAGYPAILPAETDPAAAAALRQAEAQAEEMRRQAAEAAQAIRAEAERDAESLRQKLAHEDAARREAARREVDAIHERARRDAETLTQQAAEQAAVIREQAQRESEELLSTVQSMTSDLGQMATYLNTNFSGQTSATQHAPLPQGPSDDGPPGTQADRTS